MYACLCWKCFSCISKYNFWRYQYANGIWFRLIITCQNVEASMFIGSPILIRLIKWILKFDIKDENALIVILYYKSTELWDPVQTMYSHLVLLYVFCLSLAPSVCLFIVLASATSIKAFLRTQFHSASHSPCSQIFRIKHRRGSHENEVPCVLFICSLFPLRCCSLTPITHSHILHNGTASELSNLNYLCFSLWCGVQQLESYFLHLGIWNVRLARNTNISGVLISTEITVARNLIRKGQIWDQTS